MNYIYKKYLFFLILMPPACFLIKKMPGDFILKQKSQHWEVIAEFNEEKKNSDIIYIRTMSFQHSDTKETVKLSLTHYKSWQFALQNYVNNRHKLQLCNKASTDRNKRIIRFQLNFAGWAELSAKCSLVWSDNFLISASGDITLKEAWIQFYNEIKNIEKNEIKRPAAFMILNRNETRSEEWIFEVRNHLLKNFFVGPWFVASFKGNHFFQLFENEIMAEKYFYQLTRAETRDNSQSPKIFLTKLNRKNGKALEVIQAESNGETTSFFLSGKIIFGFSGNLDSRQLMQEVEKIYATWAD